MEEQTFLNEGSVTVTNARFIVPSQTFAMAGITSVKNSEEPPKRSYPMICGIIGLLLLSGGTLVLGIGVLILAFVWWIGQKSTYHVLLATAGGEMKALSSTDSAFISKVVTAINEAMVARG